MKYINAQLKTVIKEDIHNIPVREITSYEQANQLKDGAKVTIMNNCFMNIGKICRCGDSIMVHDGVDYTSLRPDSFKDGNFMYEIMS
jgi:hypothetical protein